MKYLGTYRMHKTGTLVTVEPAGIEFFRISGPDHIRPFTCTLGELKALIERGTLTKVEGN